jgi:3-deoxy-manno-octulosonate cytidylyltransferase (CMP-KDO synthetase)
MKTENYSVTAVIPSRYASVRFPGKPLCLIKGREMILRVCDRAKKLRNINRFLVATDHKAIYELVQKNGFQACMTSEQHQSGTDRILEALQKSTDNSEFILNIQGDEPFFNLDSIDLFIADFIKNHPDCDAGTLITPIRHESEIKDPNIVKVVSDHNNKAIYFSRSPIPYLRDVSPAEAIEKKLYYRHIGVYLYRRQFLAEFGSLPASILEKTEKLEQLRILQNGRSMSVFEIAEAAPGIDTPEDLKKMLQTQF